MRTKDGLSVSSSVLFATGISALVASSAILLCGALAIQKLNRAPSVTLTSEPFAWLNQVNLATAELPAVEDGGASLSYPSKLTWSQLQLPKSTRQSSRALYAKYHSPRAIESSSSLMTAQASSAISDQLTLQSAAPGQVAESVDPARMQEIHWDVRRAFFSGLNIQASHSSKTPTVLSLQYQGLDGIPEDTLNPSVDSTKALAWIADQLPKAVSQLSVAPQTAVAKSQRNERKPSANLVQVKRVDVKSEIAAVTVKTPVVTRSKPQVTTHLNTQFEDAVRVASIQADRLMAAAATILPEVASNRTLDDTGTGSVIPGQMTTQMGDYSIAMGAASDAIGTGGLTPTPGVVGSWSGRAQSAGVNTQPAQGKSTSVASAVDTQVSTHSTSSERAAMSVTSAPDQSGDAVQAPSISYVEAFGTTFGIEGVSTEPLTQQADSRWEVSRAYDHIATLARVSSGVAQQTIPLISSNTGRLLAFNAGVQLQPEAGIVFGMVPSGWLVEFSGRSERGIYLDMSLRPVQSTSVEGARYFIFLNAAPGSQTLQVMNTQQGAGSIVIPVKGAMATFVDLSDVRMVQAKGVVYNGSAQEAEGLAKVRVRVAGSPETEKVTDNRGRFVLDRVVAAGTYPVIIETDAVAGFTHRYQVAPSRLRSMSLFRMDNEQIQDWVEQLEGGVSPESGLVVAALPTSVIDRVERQPLFPTSRTLAGNATLKPEAYALSDEGLLQVDSSIDPLLPRMIAVQLPEGPALVEARNSDKRVEWSELVFAQPGIVNVVGP